MESDTDVFTGMLGKGEALFAQIAAVDQEQRVRKAKLRKLLNFVESLGTEPTGQLTDTHRAKLEILRKGMESAGAVIRAIILSQRGTFTMMSISAQLKREYPALGERMPASYVGTTLLRLTQQGLIKRRVKGGIYHYSLNR